MKKLNKLALEIFAIIALYVYTTITNACITHLFFSGNMWAKITLFVISVLIILYITDYYVKLFMKVCYDYTEDIKYYCVKTDYRQDVIHIITFFKMIIFPFIVLILSIKEIIKWFHNIFKNGLFDK